MARHELRFPGESDEYRRARDDLLEAELALRRATEAVAAQRRELPPGGAIPEDYEFDGADGPIRLSELFGGGDTLVLYSFMYGPEMERACPSCTSIVDSLDGAAPHVEQRVRLAIVAKSPLARLQAHADTRGWHNVRLLSSAGNTYNHDYFGERDGSQRPMLNVFGRDGDAIRHFWGSELNLTAPDPGQNERHVDTIWPLWNVLDVTPQGRDGDEPFPRLAY